MILIKFIVGVKTYMEVSSETSDYAGGNHINDVTRSQLKVAAMNKAARLSEQATNEIKAANPIHSFLFA